VQSTQACGPSANLHNSALSLTPRGIPTRAVGATIGAMDWGNIPTRMGPPIMGFGTMICSKASEWKLATMGPSMLGTLVRGRRMV